MVTTNFELRSMLTEQMAKSRARDYVRAAVLNRFDEADARRQFSLDQAAETRGERAATIARSRADARNDAVERARSDNRSEVPRGEDHARIAQTHRYSQLRKDVSRCAIGGAHASSARGLADGSTSETIAETEEAGPVATSSAGTEAASRKGAAEAALAAECDTPVVTSPIQSVSISASTPAPVEPPSWESADTPIAAETTEARSIGAQSGDTMSHSTTSNTEIALEAAQLTAGMSDVGAMENGANVSAILEPADLPFVSTTASSAAKVVSGTEDAAGPTPTLATTPPLPLGGVPMTIALRALQNGSRFEIRLDPIELGRIDVQLDIDKDAGTVSADLVVDRPATLALLQRDATDLQQALAQAGLDASGGINLFLRNDGNGGQSNRAFDTSSGMARSQTQADNDIKVLVTKTASRLSGIDIRI